MPRTFILDEQTHEESLGRPQVQKLRPKDRFGADFDVTTLKTLEDCDAAQLDLSFIIRDIEQQLAGADVSGAEGWPKKAKNALRYKKLALQQVHDRREIIERNEKTATLKKIDELNQRIDDAVDLALDYGTIDGAHHRMWVIDQMIRILTGPAYVTVIKEYESDEEGRKAYYWDCGVSPR